MASIKLPPTSWTVSQWGSTLPALSPGSRPLYNRIGPSPAARTFEDRCLLLSSFDLAPWPELGRVTLKTERLRWGAPSVAMKERQYEGNGETSVLRKTLLKSQSIKLLLGSPKWAQGLLEASCCQKWKRKDSTRSVDVIKAMTINIAASTCWPVLASPFPPSSQCTARSILLWYSGLGRPHLNLPSLETNSSSRPAASEHMGTQSTPQSPCPKASTGAPTPSHRARRRNCLLRQDPTPLPHHRHYAAPNSPGPQ